MSFLSPMLLCDFYKLSHRAMYPKGTEVVYSTWTARGSRHIDIDRVVVFGLQMALQKVQDMFHDNFFIVELDDVLAEYKRVVKYTLGDSDPDTSHIEALWNEECLPITVRALPEGSLVPLRVPHFTVHNTKPEFFWLTNYLETFFSCELWQPSTSATLAFEYRKLLERASYVTTGGKDFVPFQGHDFSMRGMSSLDSAVSSGMGHLLSFVGTDTIPAIQGAEHFYDTMLEDGLIGTSVPATEHSVQCAYGDDQAYFRHILNEVHPSGIVSIVSDGYDFWDVIGRVVPQLKGLIMQRDGKCVIRPDSGDPVKIVCGDPTAADLLVQQGVVEALWEVFGGTVTPQGYKQLDSHIGVIYGDAITKDRAQKIIVGLMSKGFASTNIVFGIGSYTYQYNTRDTFGFAMKSTLCVINGVEVPIFKDPKTDDGTKKSQKGRVVVDASHAVTDGHGLDEAVEGDILEEVWRDGKWLKRHTFAEVRARLAAHLL
jgi:nicotinamide phosphoribosyltransferase